ncbi:MAG TPA: Gfo/Idh/MocA family oxidoreductase [Cyclobacteriaceae bacterium]|nr:Gfo/Idh/MocA family oxidoreductase [Cyclobacteriaceae bacterium]
MTLSNPITAAILSYGMSGEIFHAPLLSAHPGFRLVKILERSKDKARLRYPDVAVVRALEDVLADDRVELVIVNTPHDSHFDLTKKVLEAGKHAIVEKPFVTCSAEGQQLIALASGKKLILSGFQNRRWDGDFKTIQKVIEEGMLGPLVECEVHYDRYRPEVDFTTWKESNGPSSGILYNLGSHLIDQALTLFGMPESLTAMKGAQRKGGGADDFYDIRLKYKNHHVILKSSYLVRESGPRFILHGINGSFIKYGIDPQEQALKESGIPGSAGWGREAEQDWGTINTQLNSLHYKGKIETLPGNYLEFYDNIYSAIREGKDLAVKPEQALAVIKIIEAVIVSSSEGRTIYF